MVAFSDSAKRFAARPTALTICLTHAAAAVARHTAPLEPFPDKRPLGPRIRLSMSQCLTRASP